MVVFSLVSRADGLLRREAHLWLSVDIFCVDILHLLRWICFFCCCHPCVLFSSSSVALAYLKKKFIFMVERRKKNDSFGFAESLRSLVPREIRKFYWVCTCWGTKERQNVFVLHLYSWSPWGWQERRLAIRRAGTLTDRQPVQTQAGWRVPLPLLMCIQGRAKPSTLSVALLMLS